MFSAAALVNPLMTGSEIKSIIKPMFEVSIGLKRAPFSVNFKHIT